MSGDIHIRREGRAGRITLTRPKALNALSWDMVRAIDAALIDWADDPEMDLLVIDAEGERAFCAGGDIVEMYETGTAGDFDYGRRFWRDEYRMNARMFQFPKPVATFLQGFTMGGGVGVGGGGSRTAGVGGCVIAWSSSRRRKDVLELVAQDVEELEHVALLAEADERLIRARVAEGQAEAARRKGRLLRVAQH